MKRRYVLGPDPDFPYLNENERFSFPFPEESTTNIVAVGGNLSPGMLLSAYEQGIFPWYNPEDPILWQSPDPRFVLFPENLHISTSMKRIFKKNEFTIALDRNFPLVIRYCAQAERPGQNGTWITKDIMDAYMELYRLGWAHSAESYAEGELVGGCYGIRLGRVFFGESMFTKRSNASKAAFITLARTLFADGLAFIDCQVHTDHLESLGGQEMSRRRFLLLLRKTLRERTEQAENIDILDRRGNWDGRFKLEDMSLSGR